MPDEDEARGWVRELATTKIFGHVSKTFLVLTISTMVNFLSLEDCWKVSPWKRFRLKRANKSAGSVVKPYATIVTCLDSTGDSGLESPVFFRIPLV